MNTGEKNGVIRKLEEKLNKPLQWLVCQLHSNELIVHHLFEKYAGRKTGPCTYSGEISKQISQCETMPLVKFNAVELETGLPEIDSKILSKDQQYLLEISKAVVSGQCTQDLANKYPGNICHSRWLTTANRILRLYVATRKPTKNLVNLVNLVIKVYMPVWFSIKKNPNCYNGANHAFKTIVLSRCLDKDVQSVIHSVMQRNGYFLHPENVLIAMMIDERLDVRIKAMNIIFECRKSQTNEIRVFKVPKINFEAEDYVDLISWDQATEPPLIKHLSDDELKELIMSKTSELKQILHLPCHTQAVERHVKLVTEVSSAVCGFESRHARIIGTLKSRSLMPTFETKKDYAVSNLSEEMLQ